MLFSITKLLFSSYILRTKSAAAAGSNFQVTTTSTCSGKFSPALDPNSGSPIVFEFQNFPATMSVMDAWDAVAVTVDRRIGSHSTICS